MAMADEDSVCAGVEERGDVELYARVRGKLWWGQREGTIPGILKHHCVSFWKGTAIACIPIGDEDWCCWWQDIQVRERDTKQPWSPFADLECVAAVAPRDRGFV